MNIEAQYLYLVYTLLNIFFFSEMVLCDAFHTKYTKHLRRRNYYLVYQRIEIISTNAYFQNSHNTCRYLYSWGSNIMGCLLIVCVCSVVVAAILYVRPLHKWVWH